MANRLAGKVALISGGARGQGAAEARLFAAEGAQVVIGDILDDEGRRLADELNRGTELKRALYVHLDVTSSEDWDAAVAAAESAFGGLHILVNNAGIPGRSKLEDTTDEEWQRVIDIDQKGVFFGMRAAVPALRRAGGGSIVNISSASGIVGSGTSISYHAAKGAVRLMTKTAALEYATQNIRINSVLPGYIDTPMTASHAPEVQQHLIESMPMRRAARPEEVAYGVLFLASDEASYITGIDLPIDGGFTAGTFRPR